MRRLSRRTIYAAVLMLALCTNAIAQTSPNSTPAQGSPVVSDEQLIAQLVGEVKTGRELIRAQREQIAALEAQVAAEKANGTSLATSYKAAEREIEQLRKSIGFLERAVGLHEQTVAVLQSDNERLKGEARKSRRRAALAGLIAAGSIAARVFGGF